MASPKTKELDLEAMFKTLMENQQKTNEQISKTKEDINAQMQRTNEQMQKNSENINSQMQKNNDEINLQMQKTSEQIQHVKDEISTRIEKSLNEQAVKIDIKLREHKLELSNEVKDNLKKFAEYWNEKFNSSKREQETNIRLLSEAVQENADKTVDLANRTLTLEHASEELERTSTNNQDKISNVESKLQQEIQRLTTEIKRKPTQMVMCSAVTDDRYRIKFSGKKFENPMEFWLKCENEIDSIGTLLTDKEKIDFISKHLQKSAQLWFNIIRDELITYQQFKTAFAKRFWNSHVQRAIRDEIEYGKYNYKSNLTFEEYAIQLVERGKHLQPRISQDEFVQKIAYHFTRNIQLAIYTQGTDTLEKLFVLLNQSQNLNLNTEHITSTARNQKLHIRYSQSQNEQNYAAEREKSCDRTTRYTDEREGWGNRSTQPRYNEERRERDTYQRERENFYNRNTPNKYNEREERGICNMPPRYATVREKDTQHRDTRDTRPCQSKPGTAKQFTKPYAATACMINKTTNVKGTGTTAMKISTASREGDKFVYQRHNSESNEGSIIAATGC